MKTISKKISGHLIVNESTTFHNVHVESVIVEKGITARIYGIVTGEITVKKDAVAYLHGNLLGKVNIQGGSVYVFKPNGQVESFEPTKHSEKK